MSNQEKRALIEKALKLYNELDAVYDKVGTLFGFPWEGALGDATWQVANALLEHTEVACGIDDGLFTWFVYDNQQGKRRDEIALNDGRCVRVTSLKSFYKAVGI